MIKRRILAFILAIFLLPVSFPVSAKEECLICERLERLGFPPSYVESLCALSLSHPTWQWIPLPVTDLSRQMGEEAYTFSYVLAEEYGVEGRSLVSAKETFYPYQEEGSDLYDRGFYLANEEAVAYFLDPRNFLNSEDIFQFLLLSYENEGDSAQVSSVLGTSSVKGVISDLEERLILLGQKYNVSPYFLAARLRQEQGSDGNVLLYGTAGEMLGEAEYDGFYNIFNIGAYGSGANQVYRSGVQYAKEMGWSSPEKALEGGVKILSEKYVTCYQDTLYLQKWNVDPRSRTANGESRNFWAQFMQNIGGAKTESDFLREALAKEENLTFLIPVFEGMPDAPCPDPALGDCAVFAAAKEEKSPHKYPVTTTTAQKTKGEKRATDSGKKEGKIHKIWFPLFLASLTALFILLISEKNGKNSGISSFFRKNSQKIQK